MQVPGPDGVPLQLHDFGGTGPAILLVHATGLHGMVWKPLADALTSRHHCWAVDLRGHGDSALPPGADLHWSGFARDVQAARAAIDEPEVIGVGHSLGATALVMAELSSPGTVRELCLFEPAMTGNDGQPSNDHRRIQTRIIEATKSRRPRFTSKSAALTNFASKLPTSQFQAAALYQYVEHGLQMREVDGESAFWLKCSPEIEAMIYAHTYSHAVAAELHRLTCPVTLIMGEQTTQMHKTAVRELAVLFSSPIIELDSMDHFGPLQQPSRVAAEIDKSIQRNARDAVLSPAERPTGRLDGSPRQVKFVP